MFQHKLLSTVISYATLISIPSISIIATESAQAATIKPQAITQFTTNRISAIIPLISAETKKTDSTNHSGTIANFIHNAASTIGNIIKNTSRIADAGASTIGKAFSTVGSTIHGIANGILHAAQSAGNFIGKIAQGTTQTVGNVIGGAITGIGNAFSHIGFPQISSIASNIGHAVIKFGTNIGNIIATVPNTIGSAIGSTIAKLGGVISDPFSYIGNTISPVVQGVTNFVDGIPNYISNTAKNIGDLAMGVSKLSNAGSKILDSGVTNFLGAINWITNTVSRLPFVPSIIKDTAGTINELTSGTTQIFDALDKLFPGINLPRVLGKATDAISDISQFIGNQSYDISKFAHAVSDVIFSNPATSIKNSVNSFRANFMMINQNSATLNPEANSSNNVKPSQKPSSTNAPVISLLG